MTHGWEEFLTRCREMSHLHQVMALSGWDEEVMMPRGGAEARGAVNGTLAEFAHARMVDPALGELLESLAGADLDDAQAAMAERLTWQRNRMVGIPSRLARELAEAQSAAVAAWREARPANDWSLFSPALTRLLAAKQEEADAIGFQSEPYEAHLETYERGLTIDAARAMLDDVAQGLRPLLDRVLGSSVTPPSLPAGPYDTDALLAYCRSLAGRLGFDLTKGRVDLAPHPFAEGINHSDVRITTRLNADHPDWAIMATAHETGHGLYEQGLPAAWADTPIGGSVSLGVHESQSRLWENHVARSRAFWAGELGNAQAALPQLGTIDAETMYRALNVVEPSLIRVEADEMTYALHIVIRFELELALTRGDVTVDSLPDAFDELMEKHLGIRPPSHRDGVMQDIHWSMGLLGYFPTYVIGTVTAAALFDAITAEVGEIDAVLRSGDFSPILGWLRTHVHSKGLLHLAGPLIAQATGTAGDGKIDTGPFLRYMQAKFGELYP